MGWARSRTKRRPDLYRWIYRGPNTPEVFDPRNSRKSKSVFSGVRQDRIRENRDPHQAGFRQVFRPRYLFRQRFGLEYGQSSRPAATKLLSLFHPGGRQWASNQERLILLQHLSL